ncbi:MAG: helix-turn-helix domain-containing protein [Acholeplasma sp.]|nr:helix-turn-helix domain-containing protein [Acholeplasma sp.]
MINTYLVAGPALLSISRKSIDIKRLSFYNSKDTDNTQNIANLLPRQSLFSFARLLLLVSTIFNVPIDENPDLLTTYTSININPKVDESFLNQVYIWRETNNRFDEFKNEKLLLHSIENGNIDTIDKYMQYFTFETSSKLSDDSLKHYKYESVCMITLITRASISGGLDINEAFPLSDTYIRKIDAMTTHFEIKAMIYQIVMDFTHRVLKSKETSNYTNSIVLAIAFINKNLHYPISLNDIANEVNLSSKYLSEKFISEVGTPVTNYIQNQRIKESMELLKFTNKSISEISSTLCFHSQSYFNQVFKKYVNMTPKKYRETNNVL